MMMGLLPLFWLIFFIATTSRFNQWAVSVVLSVRHDYPDPLPAVAMVIKARNESRLRLLLHPPDRLFALLTSPWLGNQNQDLLHGDLTSHLWVAIDSDYDSNLFYVIDKQAGSISVVDQTTGQLFDVYTGLSAKAQALAVNWIDDAVYWTDAAYDAIFRYKGTDRCRLDECVHTVVSTNLDYPSGVAVHPHQHFLYWTNIAAGDEGTLERSDLEGGERTLLFEQLSHPSAVAIDYRTDRVYWLARSGDATVVESCDLFGGDRYSAAILPSSQFRDLEAFQGLLLMTEPARRNLVLHDTVSNTTRRLWEAEPYGVCIFSPDVRSSGAGLQRTMVYEEKDILEEGFLILVSEQGSVSILEKTAATASRDVTARQIISRDSVTAITVDVINKWLYFYDRTDEALERVDLGSILSGNGTSPRPAAAHIVSRVPQNVAGLAKDWLSGTIYWTDIHLHRVSALSADGRHVRCVACQDVNQPRDVAVHPIQNLLFWTDVDASNPRIERLNIRHNNRRVILRLFDRPLAIAIDFKDDMLYYSEGPRVCRTDLLGQMPEPCPSPSGHNPLAIKSLDILHDFVIWTDFREGVYVSDKEDNFDSLFSDHKVMDQNKFYSEIRYFHPSRQPISRFNPCAVNNGGCDQFCNPVTEHTSDCACASGYWSRINGSCISGAVEDHFVLVTDSLLGGIYQQYLYLPDYYVIPVSHLQQPSDVIFDQTTRKIYWSDVEQGTISRAYLNGSQQEIIFAHHQLVAEKLYLLDREQVLYFIDQMKQKVGVISLSTRTFRIIRQTHLFLYQDIAVDAKRGHVYLSAKPCQETPSYSSEGDLNIDTGVILRCDLNGDQMQEILTTDGEPRGLALSEEGLYWVNAGSKTLNLLDLNAENTSLVTQLWERSSPNDLTLLGEYLYWTDSEQPSLFRYRLNQGEEEEAEQSGRSILYQTGGIESYQGAVVQTEPEQEHIQNGSRDICQQEAVTSSMCLSVSDAIEGVRQNKGFCKVPTIENGYVLTVPSQAYVTSNVVITVECKPGYGEWCTGNRRITSECQRGIWVDEPDCVWAMTYNVSRSTTVTDGFYIVLTSSTQFVVPANVWHLDVLAIGGGGGGFHACSSRFAGVPSAGDGGSSRFGRYLRADGGKGGTLHSGGRGGFGTVLFGGPGELSSSCLGGGAAGQTTWSDDCRLSSTSCPFCGAGGAPTGCSTCQQRSGGCRGPWVLPGQGISADSFGGGATGWSGGGSGGGGGYSRRIVDVIPGEIIPVTVGRGGRPSAGSPGDGVVVVAWGGRLEDVLPRPDPFNVTCRPFFWTVHLDTSLDREWDSCNHGARVQDP